MDDFQGAHGAGNHARLLPGSSARFTEVGGVGAKVALGCFVCSRFPDCAMRRKWTRLDAGLAADTF